MSNHKQTGFTVVKPGIHSLIEDLGRFGYQHMGITQGGAMDPWAFIIANRLCRNPDNTSAIEVTVGGLHLKAQCATKIAVTGAQVSLHVNGIVQPLWQSIDIAAGDDIRLGFAQQGMRSYVAVHGGFAIAQAFGSNATVCREGIGGLNGQALQKGDCLPFKAMDKPLPNLKLAAEHQPKYENEVVLRVLLGYQQAAFHQAQLNRFFTQSYCVGRLADRMAYRLEGEPLAIEAQSMFSEGISYGAIQLPPDGLPIVMLNDRQTIGGYPKLGSILKVDGAKLAQLKQGDSVRFQAVELDQIKQINKHYVDSFSRIKFQSLART